MKKILIVSATQFEVQPFIEYLKKCVLLKNHPVFKRYEFDILIAGVGIAQTAMNLTRRLTLNEYNLVLNIGIAGSFSKAILRGEVVEVVEEQYGDLGVEESNGAFTDMFEMGLIEANKKPFKACKLLNNSPLFIKKIPQVTGLTVNKVHGTKKSIDLITKKYVADVETMEGAPFFEVCLTENVPFAAIRAISNFVEPRNRENWEMEKAITNLNTFLIDIFEKQWI